MTPIRAPGVGVERGHWHSHGTGSLEEFLKEPRSVKFYLSNISDNGKPGSLELLSNATRNHLQPIKDRLLCVCLCND
eukprot:scaffold135632_cov28-Attheya_sp.AAC.1